MDHPLPWLRYAEADELDAGALKFRSLEVSSDAGEKLGGVDGFLFDASSGNPYYVVVDSKGWFKTRLYLVPIGHARLDRDRGRIVIDLTRAQVGKFPGFDLDEFQSWNADDIDRVNRQTAEACCGSSAAPPEPDSRWSAEHYRLPDWWDNSYYRADRAGEDGMPVATWLPPEPAPEPLETIEHGHDTPKT
ncbi:MAG: PRC-barrel domain-containing protein [Acidobacteria bacterium]|nr:PRC-barrel domain-containing protein [Acidobacteriota bacterium]